MHARLIAWLDLAARWGPLLPAALLAVLALVQAVRFPPVIRAAFQATQPPPHRVCKNCVSCSS